MPEGRSRVRPIALLLTAFCVYAGFFIYNTSFIIDGQRYFCLFDDAMISMRYARNLADGHGLVFNPGGDRIEGYTNPLWVLYMSAWHLMPVAARLTSLAIQITAAMCLALNVYVVAALTGAVKVDDSGAPTVAAVLTAFYLPLNNWALQGMEVGLLALIMTAAVLTLVRARRRGVFPRAGYLLLAFALLVRMDMAVPLLTWTATLAVLDREQWKRHVRTGGLLLVSIIAALTLARYLYYGETLPNTYYLKMTGYPAALRITRGVLVAAAMVWRMNAFVVAIAFLAAVLRKDLILRMMVMLVAGQFAYSMYVGGDAWESWGGANRYISIAMPLFFVLFAIGIHEIGAAARRLGLRPHVARALVAAVSLLALINVNILKGPASLGQWLQVRRPMLVEGNEEMVRLAIRLREMTTADATIAVAWAGALPYFAGRPAIDLLGKNDVTIAHQSMHRPSGRFSRLYAFHPGHLKWDYGYSIGRLQPDVVAQLWDEPGEAAPWLAAAYTPVRLENAIVYLRTGSPHIRPRP